MSERPTGDMGPREAEALMYLTNERGLPLDLAVTHSSVAMARAKDQMADALEPWARRMERLTIWISRHLP